MLKLFTTLFFLLTLYGFSQENKNRKKYNITFESNEEINHLNFDNYLYGKIHKIQYEKFIYEIADKKNTLTLNDFRISYYDLKGGLRKIELYNNERKLLYTKIEFGKGFTFDLRPVDKKIKIDSLAKIIEYSDPENGNKTITYLLDNDFKVKSINTVIKDSLNMYYFNIYDKNQLIRVNSRMDTRFYKWDNLGRLQHLEQIENEKNFIANHKKSPNFILDFKYNNDTIITNKKSNNEAIFYKSVNKNDGVILPIFENNPIETITYFYNEDYSLYKMVYFFKKAKSKVIYKYELDKYGNWLKRFDNNKISYFRKLTYDKFGNWIIEEQFENGNKISETHRKITYYQ
ncbi:hypothetical protein [Flavobacterium sp. HTF]|uniref:hypothetical protein n=1 Tax=Flavobacterium sp. HTF TaxID=2170732 RepID=UPI000D5E675C|nr:hypothetical protein [Flavobacterium sp. HTF]PWB24280.1 hypothetical protein DCO46_12175 [Flavobacterium sp. HTF]